MILELLLMPLTLLIVPNFCYNYCHKTNICGDNKHFICNMEKELPPLAGTAKFLALAPETYSFRKAFIDKHNELRNSVGDGIYNKNNESYPNATRLREVIWDDELAYMARVHAYLVCNKHSKCHATKRFPLAGQNLGLMTEQSICVKCSLTLIDAMFEEHLLLENDTATALSKFIADEHHIMGHFTVIVNDRVSRIGCGIALADHIEENDSDRRYLFLTCHYDFTNLVGSYIYKTGETASECDDWNVKKSSKYPNLCKNSGEIFPPDHASMK